MSVIVSAGLMLVFGLCFSAVGCAATVRWAIEYRSPVKGWLFGFATASSLWLIAYFGVLLL